MVTHVANRTVQTATESSSLYGRGPERGLAFFAVLAVCFSVECIALAQESWAREECVALAQESRARKGPRSRHELYHLSYVRALTSDCFDEAILLLEAALVQPATTELPDPLLHVRLGQAYALKGDMVQAVRALRRARSLDREMGPDLAEAAQELAVAEAKTGSIWLTEAHVQIDGRPIVLEQDDSALLLAGEHELRFDAEGYWGHARVNVEAGAHEKTSKTELRLERIEKLAITAVPASTMISVDGAPGAPGPLLLSLERGEHRVRASAERHEVYESKVTVDLGSEPKTLTIALLRERPPEPVAVPASTHWKPWVGSGLAALGAGALTLTYVTEREIGKIAHELESICLAGEECSTGDIAHYAQLQKSARNKRRWSIAEGASGGALLAAGIALWIWHSSSPGKNEIAGWSIQLGSESLDFQRRW